MSLSRALLAYAFAIVVVVVPILANPYLPLVDIPNHIARLFIAANPQSALSQYYDYQLDLTPNSAADLLWEITGHPFGAIKFAQLIFVIYAANLVISAIVLARVIHGKWLIWPAASALLVYNAPFFWGFQNFLFTVPFAIYGLALWLHMEKYSNWLRVAVFIPYCLLLFWMHLFPFVLLAVAVLGRELQRVLEAGETWHKALISNISLALPFFITAALLAYVIQTSPPNPAAGPSIFGSLQDRYYALFSPVGEARVTLRPTGGLVFVLLLSLFLLGLRGGAPYLRISRQMRGPLIAVLLLCVFIPVSINGVALVHIRFPFVFMVLFIAATQWQHLHRNAARIIAIAIGVALFLRGAEFYLDAAEYSQDIKALEHVLEKVPSGSRILPVRSAGNQRDNRYWHVQAYAVPMAESFVPTLFQGVHSLRIKPEWTNSANPASMSIDQQYVLETSDQTTNQKTTEIEPFWYNWTEKYTHLLLLDPQPEDWPTVKMLRLVKQYGRFTLFEIIKP